MNDETTSDRDRDRSLALLSIAARQRDSADSACPPDDRLAAFIEGRLNGEPRQEMLAHLNRCPACYRHWLEAADFVIAAAPPVRPGGHGVLAGGWQDIRKWLGSEWIALPLAAAAVALALWVMPLIPKSIETALDDDYVAVLAENPGRFAAVVAAMPVPWGSGEILSFSDAPSQAPPARAFAAGLWEGQKTLAGRAAEPLPGELAALGKEAWDRSQWSAYHALGRWSALAWTLSQDPQAAADWESLQKSLDAIAGDLPAVGGDESAQRAGRAIQRLGEPLGRLRNGAGEAARTDLSRVLGLVMQQLGS